MNTHRQMIGNGDNSPQVYTRSFSAAPQIGEGFNQFPGLDGNLFSGYPQGGGLPAPFQGGGGFLGGGGANPSGGGGFLSNLLGGGGASTGSSNPLSGLNLKQISGFVERMGGIDGIIGTMGKVQKVVSSFQQMAPMIKVLFNSFSKVKSTNTDIDDDFPRKRKRRKKSSTKRRKGSKPTPTKRKRK